MRQLKIMCAEKQADLLPAGSLRVAAVFNGLSVWGVGDIQEWSKKPAGARFPPD
jgi:hypothetical protein